MLNNQKCMKLGKLPSRLDMRTLRFSKYNLNYAPPIRSMLFRNILSWGMFRNDAVGNCTIAAAMHAQQHWTTNAGIKIALSDEDAINAYSAVTGFDPVTGWNDYGAVEMDVLKYWRMIGIGGHQILAYTSLNKNVVELKQAISIFGLVYSGFDLPLIAQNQEIWDTVSFSAFRGKAQKGSWGGHAITLVGYDADYIYFISWGELRKMTYSFYQKYLSEQYVIISEQWLKATGESVSGFDLDTLRVDLSLI